MGPLHPIKYKADDGVVQAALTAAFPAPPGRHPPVFLLDAEYKVVSENELLAVARSTHTAALKYESNYFDCDKFARLFWARVPLDTGLNSVGLMLNFAGRHAYNVAFVQDGDSGVKVVTIEPQQDTEVVTGSSQPYTLVPGEYRVIF